MNIKESNPIWNLTKELTDVDSNDEVPVNIKQELLKIISFEKISSSNITSLFPVSVMRDRIHAALRRLITEGRINRIKINGEWHYFRN